MSAEKLKEMSKFTILTGVMSEAHINNMKLYPFLFLDGVESAEVSYNIPGIGQSDEKPHVTYTVTFKEGFTGESPKDGVDNLKKAVKVLFQMSNLEVNVFNAQGKKLE